MSLMAAHNLHNYKLTRNLSPRTSQDMALALTGHRKESDLDRFLALALHYASWSLEEATLAEYLALLTAVEPEDGTQLLDYLSSPATFAIRGDHDSLPAALVRQSQAAAKEWRRRLAQTSPDALRLRKRALTLLTEHLQAKEEAQRMVVAELQVLVMCRNDNEGAAGQPGQPAPMGNIVVRKGEPRPESADGAGQPGDSRRMTRTFSNPAEALAFIMAVGGFGGVHAISFSPGQPIPAGPMPHPSALAPTNAAPPAAEPTEAGASKHRVYDCAEAFAVLQKMPPPSPNEGNNQQRRVLENMSADQGWRLLTQTPAGAPLAELYANFPHFTPVIDHVARHLALAACGTEGRPVRIAPLLLRGAPGTGKTFFAQALARVLGTHFVERDLSVISEAFVIAGFDASWKGSKPGIVFEALVNGKSANPIICLNEVDKAKSTGAHNSPLAALYGLLEPTSAERFVDEFVPVHLDASKVTWVLTCNDGFIPEPILTRLEIFDIPLPTQEQCRAIASSVWANICAKTLPVGHDFDERLPEELLTAVSAMSPRLMRRALTGAVGAAALAGRKFLQRSDLDVGAATGAPQRSIGFLS